MVIEDLIKDETKQIIRKRGDLLLHKQNMVLFVRMQE